jgi:hypothetical protein
MVLHVGLHKTGSTFLQRVLFDIAEELNAQGVHWMPRPALDEHYGFGKVVRNTQNGGSSSTRAAKQTATKLRSLVAKHRVTLISNETVLSRRVFFDYEGDAYTPGLPVLEWLRDDVTRDLRILMYVRRQDHFLESAYLQQINQGSTQPFDEWYESTDPSRFGWLRLAQQIEAIVGPGNLTIRPFEIIHEGSEAFCRGFLQAVDPSLDVALPLERIERISTRSNPSLSQRGVDLAMLVYPELTKSERITFRRVFLQRYLSNRQFERAKLLNDDEAARLRALHRPGNTELFRRYMPELDPQALGYV